MGAVSHRETRRYPCDRGGGVSGAWSTHWKCSTRTGAHSTFRDNAIRERPAELIRGLPDMGEAASDPSSQRQGANVGMTSRPATSTGLDVAVRCTAPFRTSQHVFPGFAPEVQQQPRECPFRAQQQRGALFASTAFRRTICPDFAPTFAWAVSLPTAALRDTHVSDGQPVEFRVIVTATNDTNTHRAASRHRIATLILW